MRKTLLMSAALLGMGVMAAAAQTPASGTTPPAAPAAEAPPVAAPAPMHARSRAMTHRRIARARRAPANEGPVDANTPGGLAPADQYSGVPPTSAYQGGAGSPRSNAAANIDASDTRSQIAPRLPDPAAGGNTPEAYLAAAQRALSANQTGAAQEALERAQTRVLTRSTDPSQANVPDDSRISQAISDARRALANRDVARAQAAISAVLNRAS